MDDPIIKVIHTSIYRHIVIFGSSRSGTHALGSLFAKHSTTHDYIGSISFDNVKDLDFFGTVQLAIEKDLTPKIFHIDHPAAKAFLKKHQLWFETHCTTVKIIRQDKVKQFASWYHMKALASPWYNAKTTEKIADKSCVVSLDDIKSFVFEQRIDELWRGQYELIYEHTDFSDIKFIRNTYANDDPLRIFANPELIIKHLSTWTI